MCTEDSNRFFNLYFPPQFSSQFIAMAEKMEQRGQSSDEAIRCALEEVELNLPSLNENWQAFGKLIGSAAGESSGLCDTMEQAVMDCRGEEGYAENLFSLADSDLRLRMAAADAQQQVIQTIVASLPENIPASQLSHLIGALMVPVGPIRLLPSINLAGADGSSVIDGVGEVSQKLLAFIKVVLFAIGIEALFDLIVGDAAIMKTFVKLWQAVLRRDLTLIGTLLEELLGQICGQRFRKKIAKKLGKKAAAKMIGRVLAKVVPILGWALLIASIIYAVYENWDELVDP